MTHPVKAANLGPFQHFSIFAVSSALMNLQGEDLTVPVSLKLRFPEKVLKFSVFELPNSALNRRNRSFPDTGTLVGYRD
jgi:hypothetical protein